MIVILLGIVVGGLAAWGPLGFLAWPAAHLSVALVGLGSHLSVLLTHHRSTRTASIVNALCEALVPAVVAAGLLISARLVKSFKHLVTAVALIGGIAGFFFLPFGEAAGLFVFCCLVGGVAQLVGTLASGFLAFCGAYLAVGTIHSLWHQSTKGILWVSAQTLSHFVSLSPFSIRIILGALIVIICLMAASFAVRGHNGASTN